MTYVPKRFYYEEYTVKYDSCIAYHLRLMAHVEGFCKQTKSRQGENYMPLIYGCRGIKMILYGGWGTRVKLLWEPMIPAICQ